MRYERVLVALDDGQTASRVLSVATMLARAWDARLDPVHVPAELPGNPPQTQPTPRLLAPGDPAEALLAEAGHDPDATLLTLGTRALPAASELVFGSVCATVVRRLLAPVVIVAPNAATPEHPPRRILTPLDGSTTADAILPVAARWARSLNCSLELLHVIYPPGDPRQGEVRLPEEVDQVAERLRSHAAALSAEGVDASWRLHEATSSGAGIVDHARRTSTDIIAMATHGRGALARLMAGSTTIEVVRHTALPVLALRPAGLDTH